MRLSFQTLTATKCKIVLKTQSKMGLDFNMKKKNKLIAALQTKDTVTPKGAISHSTTGSAVLDFFGKAGSLRAQDEKEVLKYFSSAYSEDKTLALRALFWAGDARQGAGERRLFRVCFNWLANNDSKIASNLIEFIPEYRRFDDILESVENTPVEKDGLKYLSTQLKKDIKADRPTLLAKWLPSENTSSEDTRRLGKKMREYMKLSSKEYRKTLSRLREKINVVEKLMTANEWKDIDFSKVPSKAALLYKKAFNKHVPELYSKFLTKVEKGEAKINASVLYPYDIIRQILNSTGNDSLTLEVQWKALPNYLKDNPFNGLVVADVSGSMTSSGYHSGKNNQVRPIDVCISLAIYIAERNEGAFKDYFLTFSEESKLQKLVGPSLKDKVEKLETSSWNMTTNLQSAFDAILNAAIKNKVPEKEMVSKVFIISDMAFDSAVSDNSLTNLETIKAKYKQSGYKLPEIVFWNVNAQSDVPVKMNDKGVCLVSGASPSILESVLSGKVVSPYDIMINTLNSKRYEPIEA